VWAIERRKKMNRIKHSTWIFPGWIMIALFLAGALVVGPAKPAVADDRQEAAQIVEKARFTMENFMKDDNMDAFRDLLHRAEGVFIAPQLLKGAFIVGASGGNGVFLARDRKAGTWSSPAFYTIGGASFGLQIGGEASEVILLMMTDRGVNSLMGNSVKLGGDVGVAAGPVGIGAAASTANLSADVISFSRSKGLYGGISLEGAVVAVRGSLNEAYYGKPVTPTDIVIRRDVRNPDASALVQAVAKSATQKTAARKSAVR
jgi:lipid-binding SYLF domain-containing protein